MTCIYTAFTFPKILKLLFLISFHKCSLEEQEKKQNQQTWAPLDSSACMFCWFSLRQLRLTISRDCWDNTQILGCSTDSSLAGDINERGTITVLVVENSTLSSISGRSKDSIKAIISTHIILDYYDEKKLRNIRNDSTTLTNLYQSSGIANDQQGFLLAYNAGGGHFYFGSAVKGAPLNAQFVKTVVTQPYNVSVLQVSQPIIAPGIDAQSPWPAPGAQTKFPPKQGDYSEAPAGSPSDDDSAADAPSDDTGDDDTDASSPSPSTAPVPAPADAPGPSDDSAANDGGSDSTSASSSTRVKMGLVGTAMAFASLLVAL